MSYVDLIISFNREADKDRHAPILKLICHCSKEPHSLLLRDQTLKGVLEAFVILVMYFGIYRLPIHLHHNQPSDRLSKALFNRHLDVWSLMRGFV